MKKALAFVCVLMLFSLSLCYAASDAPLREIYSGGDFIRLVDRYSAPPEGYTGIYTADDLFQIVHNPSGKFMLMNDIDLKNAQSAVNELRDVTFRGILEGNGCRLTGFSRTVKISEDDYLILAGLFSEITDGQIRNLYLSGSILLDADELGYWERLFGVSEEKRRPFVFIGAFAGGMGGNSEMYNCTADVSVSYTERAEETLYIWYPGSVDHVMSVGGLLGAVVDGNISVSYCRSRADIRAPRLLGGIAGYQNNRTGDTLFYACENLGDLYSDSDSVGGILGFAQDGQTLKMQYCANRGDITGDNCICGLLGYHLSKNTDSRIENCINLGSVYAHQESFILYDVAAVVMSLGGDLYDDLTGEYFDLTSYSYYDYGGKLIIGGIAGHTLTPIENCVNLGSVKARYYGAMGICGANYGRNVIGCYSTDDNEGALGNYKGDVIPTADCKTVSRSSGAAAYGSLSFSPAGWLYRQSESCPYPAALCADRWLQYEYAPGKNALYDSDVRHIRGNAEREAAFTFVMDQYEYEDYELEGTIICFIEGYGRYPSMSNKDNYERSTALCVVLKNGRIVFSMDSCATFPDNPTSIRNNGGSRPVPTIIEGKLIYKECQHNVNAGHMGYPALKINAYEKGPNYSASVKAAPAVRLNASVMSTTDTLSDGCNIHMKSSEKRFSYTSSAANSTGCTVIGAAKGGSYDLGANTTDDYARFAAIVGFGSDPDNDGYADNINRQTAPSRARGLLIINRSCGYEHVKAFRDSFDDAYRECPSAIPYILGYESIAASGK